jgi:hypothetical protein
MHPVPFVLLLSLALSLPVAAAPQPAKSGDIPQECRAFDLLKDDAATDHKEWILACEQELTRLNLTASYVTNYSYLVVQPSR